MYDAGLQEAIVINTLSGSAKGGIYENFIADILIKKGYRQHYYKTDRSSMDIEFLIVSQRQVLPLEVKALNNATLFLNEFLVKFGNRYGIKLITGNVGVVEKKVNMAMFL